MNEIPTNTNKEPKEIDLTQQVTNKKLTVGKSKNSIANKIRLGLFENNLLRNAVSTDDNVYTSNKISSEVPLKTAKSIPQMKKSHSSLSSLNTEFTMPSQFSLSDEKLEKV